ncbi:putative fructose-bisphosphate aldolase [Helianthus annuus]|nr:putative fructose-bisphosphate aldolase [Helianthus annuus]
MALKNLMSKFSYAIQEYIGWGWGWGLGVPSIFANMDPSGSPFTRLVQVCVAVYKKRNLPMVSDAKILYENEEHDASISVAGRLLHTKQMNILAVDGSIGTFGKHLSSINVESNRRALRELLFCTPGALQYLSGVILFKENLYQKTGKLFVDAMKEAGVLFGLKVDKGTIKLVGTNAINSRISALLEDKIQLLVYAGEYDLICNWLGNSRWIHAMSWPDQKDFIFSFKCFVYSRRKRSWHFKESWPFDSVQCVTSVLLEAGSAVDDNPYVSTSFSVIDAFDIPKYGYDPIRKMFSSTHGDFQFMVMLLQQLGCIPDLTCLPGTLGA